MKARKTIVSVDADLQEYKKITDARLDKAAKLAKAQAVEIEGLKARVEVLEHANTKTAPTKKAPAETGKAKNQPKAETGKAPTKTKTKNKVWVAKKDRDKVYKAMSEKAPGAKFNRKLYEKTAIELGVAHEYTK